MTQNATIDSPNAPPADNTPNDTYVIWVPYASRKDVTIRQCSADDLEGVPELWRVAEAEPTDTDDVRSLQQLLASDPEALLVAQAGNNLVGSVIAGWDGWRGSIYRLAVVPGHRRRGLASDLLQAAVARLRGVGAVWLQAIVVETDDQALGFWDDTAWERQVHRVRFVSGQLGKVPEQPLRIPLRSQKAGGRNGTSAVWPPGGSYWPPTPRPGSCSAVS